MKITGLKYLVAFFFLIPSIFGKAQERTTAQDSIFTLQNYIKIERRIPMRDGAKLFTSIFIPKDTSQKYPLLICRTPYSVAPYGENNFRIPAGSNRLFDKEKMIFVYQDVRGRYLSEGKFIANRPYIKNKKSNKDVDESSDTYDIIDWLLQNVPGNNGKAGIWGISSPGFYISDPSKPVPYSAERTIFGGINIWLKASGLLLRGPM